MAFSTNRSFAVVTGASSGIGLELARVFAQNGYDVLVTADSDKLQDAVTACEAIGANVLPVQADLAQYDGVEKLADAIQSAGRPVDAIAINAGVGVGGDFVGETELDTELNIINLNVTSTVHLAKRVLPQMVERRAGRVLFTALIAGTMPTPLEAVYGASKAFVLSFAHSLRYELKDTGVTVTAVLPGPTDTNFFHRAGMDDTEVGTKGKLENSPAEVARQAFDALLAGDEDVFAGNAKLKAEGTLGKFIPESVKASQHLKMAEHGSAKKA
jgi:short-subunit dehydrogenase